MNIEVCGLNKSFGDFAALTDINLVIPQGELVALIGPSGSGKTTLLRIISGLEVPTSGLILIDGEDATYRTARERQVGFVFQHYALFRHMTVFDNIAFGLRVKPRAIRLSKEKIKEKVFELLNLVQLEGLAKRYPSQLSGGQRQRIALARALAVEPSMLLLDEPFGALDAKVRKELRRWLRRLHDEIHVTSVFVTHDQEEALEVADRVVIMHRGKIEQVGSPEEVYDHPANPFVFDFLGNVNLFHGRVDGGQAHLGDLKVAVPEHAQKNGLPAVAYVRPHEIELYKEKIADDFFPATIRAIIPIGPIVRVELIRADNQDHVEVELGKVVYNSLQLKVGEQVYVRPKNLKVFVEEGEK